MHRCQKLCMFWCLLCSVFKHGTAYQLGWILKILAVMDDMVAEITEEIYDNQAHKPTTISKQNQ